MKSLKRQVKKNSSILVQGGKPRGPFKNFVSQDPLRPWYPARFHYTQTNQFTTGAANTYGTEIVYFLNRLPTPSNTTPHQPYGFDQMEALYRKYKVNGVTVRMDIYDPSVDGVIVGMQFQSPSSAAVITGKPIDAIKEQPMSITRNISDSGNQRYTVTQYFPMHTLCGVTPLQFKSDVSGNYTGFMDDSVVPAQVPYLRIAAAHKASAGVTVYVRTTIIFHSQLFDRFVLGQST